MRINLNDPTEYEAAEWAGTLAKAQEVAEMIEFDPKCRCPNCNNVLNLDIWELPDGTGQMMEVCECGFTRIDCKRIVIEHDLPDDFG